MSITRYRFIGLLLVIFVFLLNAGCENGVLEELRFPPPINTQPPDDSADDSADSIIDVTDSSKYIFSTDTDGQGNADLTEGLAAHGYLSFSFNKQYVQVMDRNHNPLKLMHVGYWIDQQSDLIYLRIKDPTGRLLVQYEVRSIRDLRESARTLDSTSTQAVLGPLFTVFMRAYSIYGTATSILDLILFSLDMDFYSNDSEIVFQGTVSDFHTLFNGISTLFKLPVVLKRNIKISRNSRNESRTTTIKNASKINSSRPSQNLIDILEEVGGYVLANNNTLIEIKLSKLDGWPRYLTVEVLSETSTNTPTFPRQDFNIRIRIEGYDNPFFSFDPFSRPDFAGFIIVAGERFTIEKRQDSYLNERIIENVSLGISERVELTVLDKDPLVDDEVSHLVFTFDRNPIFVQKRIPSGEIIANIDLNFVLQ